MSAATVWAMLGDAPNPADCPNRQCPYYSQASGPWLLVIVVVVLLVLAALALVVLRRRRRKRDS